MAELETGTMSSKTRDRKKGETVDATDGRLAAVAAGLGARKLDALLVSAGPNVRYLSGFTGR